MNTYFLVVLFYQQIAGALAGRNQAGPHIHHLQSSRGK